MKAPAITGIEALKRAKYKLRQAGLMLGHLRHVPHEIALEMRKAREVEIPDWRLDAYFSACLGLAQSAFYIVDQVASHKSAFKRWKSSLPDDLARQQFNRMVTLRDQDVHYGQQDGMTLAKMIPIMRGSDDDSWMYMQRPNYALLGVERPETKFTNPDGSTVSSYEGLQSSLGLYIEVAGQTWDAVDACALFIARLTQMIDAVEGANELPPDVAEPA